MRLSSKVMRQSIFLSPNKNSQKMSNTTIKLITILGLAFLIAACSNKNDETPIITITGTANSIEAGKDGYTTQITTEDDAIYHALISISNLGGIENYARLAEGDEATLKGKFTKIDNKNQLMVTEIVKTVKKNVVPTINNDNFAGITLGDKIADHAANLKKDVLKDGEGSFDIYRIQSDVYGSIAYLFPSPNDETIVGQIVINSPAAKTADGIHVGSTFENMMAIDADVQVHGSEIEGRTYANYANETGIAYRLNTQNYVYDIAKEKIAPRTKITEIVILPANKRKDVVAEFCWASAAATMYFEPNNKSKKLWTFSKGEVLEVTGSRVVDGQQWLQVQFTGEVKMGYEDQLTIKGQPKNGETTGWIQGEKERLVRCK